jgi:flagellar assembly protein FliH
MSYRARLVATDLVERFDWSAADLLIERSGDNLGAAALDVVDEPLVALRPEPVPLEVTAGEQQAKLATIERDAFAKGYAQGERAGMEAGARRADAMLRRVAQTLEDLSHLRKAIVRETESQMVQLALALARRVVHREVSLDPMLVAAMAHVALERIGESTPATIKLHPEDFAIVAAHRGEAWESAHVRVLPEPSVARGGCVVESEFGVVDGSLDAQFEELARALLGDAHQPAVAVHD